MYVDKKRIRDRKMLEWGNELNIEKAHDDLIEVKIKSIWIVRNKARLLPYRDGPGKGGCWVKMKEYQ